MPALRKPPKCYDESRHYGGNHVLFHNGSTSKRFPQLAAIPQTQLASMFNVPMIDKEEEKLKELEYCEPHQDPRINFRSSAPPTGSASPYFGGSASVKSTSPNSNSPHQSQQQRLGTATSSGSRTPFVPVNPSRAKDEIAVTRESVLVGTYYDQILAEKKIAQDDALARERISTKAFTSTGNSLKAAENIQGKDYLQAVDSDIAKQVRELTHHRIKVNREIMEEKARSQRVKGRSAPRTLRADSPPANPRGPK